jgi:hypothetical protein
VVKWRRQYAEDGLAGLKDAPRPGGPKTVLTDEVVCEILAATVTRPPESLQAAGVTHWWSRRRLVPIATMLVGALIGPALVRMPRSTSRSPSHSPRSSPVPQSAT